jgi:hypothetical protein
MTSPAETLAIIQSMIDHGIVRVVKHDPNDPLQDTLEITEKGMDEKEYQKYIKKVTKEGYVLNK